jgi:hypothetical protein
VPTILERFASGQVDPASLAGNHLFGLYFAGRRRSASPRSALDHDIDD